MKIKESLKGTKEKILIDCGKYGKKILLLGAGLGLTYIGFKTGDSFAMFRTSRGFERLHREGFIQFNDPMTGKKDISAKECREALENYKRK